ncbi:MAG: glycosyltransferase [Gemmatales bacterium]
MTSTPELFTVCIPIFNDWESAREIARRLQAVTRSTGQAFHLVLVDDASTIIPRDDELAQDPYLNGTTLLQVRRNLGHQRAIAIGLTYIFKNIPCRGVVVMDGDGEDAPEDVPHLIQALTATQDSQAVFAKRMKRTESLLFRFFYFLFRLVHLFLTGRKVEVGNFSVLPQHLLARLVGVSEMWNHYAAAVVKARLPMTLVPLARGKRIQGESKMNFVSLVTHGLSAISVFSDEIGVRLLVALISCLGLFVLAIVGLLIMQPLASVTYAPTILTAISGLIELTVMSILLAVVFVLIILQGRNVNTFLPLRDFEYFILRAFEVQPHGGV